MRAGRRESGSSTVLVAGAIGLLFALVGAAAVLLSAMLAAGRAAAAADLAALAAASAIQQGQPASAACATAAALSTRNRASMEACVVRGQVVDVVCTSPLRLSWPGVPRQASARSRAGPDDG